MYAGIKCILKNCFNFVYTQKCLKEDVATKKKQKNQKRKNPVPKVSSREFLVVVRRSHFLQRRTEEREVDHDQEGEEKKEQVGQRGDKRDISVLG